MNFSQIVILGTGKAKMEKEVASLTASYKGKVCHGCVG